MLIIIKDKNSFHVAVTAFGAYDDFSVEDMLHEENLPLWRVQNVPKCLMATPGVSAFGYDLLRYGDFNLRSALTPTNIITKILPAIRQRLSEFDQLSKDGYNWGEIVIAKGGKAFRLTSNFTYEVIEESLAVGRGSDVARGALMLTKGLPPSERIKQVCRVLERTRKDKHFPAVVMNTATDEKIILYDT